MTATYYVGTVGVRRILQNDFKFSGTTHPSDTDVVDTIEEVQDEIDQQTQHAWREKTVTNEFYSFPFDRIYDHSVGLKIHLRHREIASFDTNKGDKIEIWNGSSYEDWVADKTVGRNEDYWLENEQGILHLRFYHPFFREKAIRISYRYGEGSVPKDIRRATTILTAIQLLENDERSCNAGRDG